MFQHVVSQEWLLDRLEDSSLRVVDCRFQLMDPQAGRRAYERDHIPGAVYFDLEKDLSAPVGEHGGRHPLPDPQTFAEKLGRAGIDDSITVVAYDDQRGMVASRLWWMLRYLGHEKVFVLNGNYSLWKEKGYPVTDEVPSFDIARFFPRIRTEMVVDMERVRDRIGRDEVIVIDSREGQRYRGETEPIDPVAGHIPSARNFFWGDCMREDGTWYDPSTQKKRFSGVNDDAEIIVYCGSGVSACPNILALCEAGYDQVKLYAGSWSDWCSYPDNPIAVGDDE